MSVTSEPAPSTLTAPPSAKQSFASVRSWPATFASVPPTMYTFASPSDPVEGTRSVPP